LNQSVDSSQAPLSVSGALERKLVFQRDDWHVVECAACEMVFIGDKALNYFAQAAEHDWVEDYEKEALRRKKDRPLADVLVSADRPLKRDATERQFLHALHWKREGSWLRPGMRRRAVPGFSRSEI